MTEPIKKKLSKPKPNPKPLIVDSDPESNNDNLEEEFKKLDCKDEKFFSDDCNKFLLKKELIERNDTAVHDNFLYPTLNDKEFNIKIATKKEFNDTKYDGKIHEDIKKQSDELANADFEIQPHQAFVRNYMSFQTPYSSLLLYHGLGSGKTLASIGICEEMRSYMKQTGITKRIIIVASENVQDNFKLQLFDERKLKLVDGIWTNKSGFGNKLLNEINPTNMKGLTKEKVISQIKNIINTYYIFLGYVQFANYIIKTMNYEEEVQRQKRQKDIKGDSSKKPKGKTRIQMLKDVKIELNSRIINRLRAEFDNRLIVIDEVHNIRKTDDNSNKMVAINLELLTKSAQNMRFLFLSATPMYNSYKEIVWLLNLMNTNDRRARIHVKDIFKKNGDFIKSDTKDGEEMLIRKATGYISFVRGENPYTFPYRVYPNIFARGATFPAISYPNYQMNLKKIGHEDKKRILSLYLTTLKDCNNCGDCQYCVYKYIIHYIRNTKFTITTKTGIVRDMPTFDNMESFGYTMLQTPLEALIISYPIKGLKSVLNNMPSNKYSKKFAPSCYEQEDNEADDEDEEDIAPQPMEEENEGEITEPVEPAKEKKPLIIESSSYSSDKIGGETSEEPVMRIEPKQLTGKNGLSRMMDYVDDKNTKGEFEYKKSVKDIYGNIFSTDLIGKYSSKIKCILDNIVNPDSGIVSEGIILIYSQYIDSGLIPMALALEEMGFVRYGQNTKSFFKNRPTHPVDVKTMREPADKKHFEPARYAMITGDPRISPNNDYEVKGVTNDNNKDGSKIKVILISKAGSEGIDFKFIRQIHILEPWYNMNRAEQIIGRGVRNFSHKDLPFEKRNVQIFMHGTILGNNAEEAADLYVYRVAECKAIQIGKVTRVLKETAVDCLLNNGHGDDKTDFSQENFDKHLKDDITQELSNGLILNDFKIGDAPFSPACDYMADCNYNCRPDKNISEKDLNEDTYNESFIVVNSEKIMQRIRMLMKESFFYKKDTLLQLIRTPKEYPYVQIFSALTQLVEDQSEFIVDKYGRNGRLINIGEYYLFQPLELTDKNASIFERSTPIDYKHQMIDFELKQNVVKAVIDKRNVNKLIIQEGEELSEGNKIVEEMKSNLEICRDLSDKGKVPRGDDNWYKHCGIVIKKMKIDYPESEEYLEKMIVAHMIELLLFEEKLELMNYLYSIDNMDDDKSIEWLAKDYFEKHSIITKKFTSFIMYKLNVKKIMILNKKNNWIEAEPEDKLEIEASSEAKKYVTIHEKDYNDKNFIGFIGYEKSNRYLVFKTKNMASKRDTGARCDEAGKIKTIQKINEILGETKFTNENTKSTKNKNGKIITEAVGSVELCVFQEFILRFLNETGDKVWFLTPEMAIMHKFYTIFV
jgi:hypothetical protein